MRFPTLRLLALATLCAAGGAVQAQDAPSTADLEALYWARQDSALANHTDDDVRFMAGMIGHHAQALVMSRMAPTHGASPSVQRLAARIINAQRDEIATMQRWLVDRGHAAPQVRPDGTMATAHDMERGGAAHDMDGHGTGHEGMNMDHEGMDHSAGGAAMDHEGMDHEGMDHEGMTHGEGGAEMDHGAMGHDMDHGAVGHAGMDHSDMPGMLSDAQLAELDAARGVDFDRLFLAYMIQHHGGAIVMVDDLFGADGAAQDGATFKLASDIQVDQRTEIDRMQQMLDAID